MGKVCTVHCSLLTDDCSLLTVTMDTRPLAERMRPVHLADYISQSHLVGEKGALRMQIEKGVTPSLIFWGLLGTGNTTLPHIIAKEYQRPFFSLSAFSSGIKDVRDFI